MTQLTGAQIEFAAGSMIFQQGDPGGDLYLLKSGEVEVFRMSSGVEVRLTTLKEGEILGIMTCLTREPRLASARALSDVKALVVKQAGFKTLISSTPAWVHTVIKDFTIRIKNMDDLYAKAMERLGRQDRDVSMLTTASIIASGLGEIGALITSPSDQPRLVDIDRVLVHLAKILNSSLPQVQQVFGAFVETGVLRVDPKASSRKAELPVLERMGGFTEFCRKFLDSKDHRRACEALDAKDCTELLTFPDKAKASGGKLKIADEARGLAARAAAARLLDFDADAAIISLVPHQLVSGVRYLLVIQKLRAISRESVAVPAVDTQAVQVIAENF